MGASASISNHVVVAKKKAGKKSKTNTKLNKKKALNNNNNSSHSCDLKLEFVDKETVKLLLDSELNKKTDNKSTCPKVKDVQRCYFLNPTDRTYLVIELGPNSHCDACLVKKEDGHPTEILYRINSQLMIQEESNHNNSSNKETAFPPIKYATWIESQVKSNGAPTGHLRWRGEVLIPTVYIPCHTRLYCADLLSNNCGVPNDRQFSDVSEVLDGESTHVLSLKDTNGYSKEWLNYLPDGFGSESE